MRLYTKVSDLNIPIVQLRNMNIMAKVIYTLSKKFIVRFTHTKNFIISYVFFCFVGSSGPYMQQVELAELLDKEPGDGLDS